MIRPGKKKISVFCGYGNTGGIAYNIADGLRKNGIRADAVVIDEHKYSYSYHKKIKYFRQKPLSYLNRILKYYYFIKHILLYDVFIFNTRSTLLSRNWDLPILKSLGKKTAMIYVGCDIRDKNFYLNSPDKYTVCKDCSDEYQKYVNCIMETKIKESSYIGKYIDKSFSHPFDATILNNNFDYLYLLLDLDKYSPDYEINNKIRVLHAPSDDSIKGTSYILNSMNELKSQGIEFEFELIRNKPHSEALEAVKECDVLIDQMTAGWYGLISVESMAYGKTTVCYIKDKLYKYLPEIPIVNLNPDNLTEGLKKLIQEPSVLPKYGKRGRDFVEKYHSHKKNSLNMLNEILAKDKRWTSYD